MKMLGIVGALVLVSMSASANEGLDLRCRFEASGGKGGAGQCFARIEEKRRDAIVASEKSEPEFVRLTVRCGHETVYDHVAVATEFRDELAVLGIPSSRWLFVPNVIVREGRHDRFDATLTFKGRALEGACRQDDDGHHGGDDMNP